MRDTQSSFPAKPRYSIASIACLPLSEAGHALNHDLHFAQGVECTSAATMIGIHGQSS